jgi:hypothetical protein
VDSPPGRKTMEPHGKASRLASMSALACLSAKAKPDKKAARELRFGLDLLQPIEIPQNRKRIVCESLALEPHFFGDPWHWSPQFLGKALGALDDFVPSGTGAGRGNWIASSQGLLAMTDLTSVSRRQRRAPPSNLVLVDVLNHLVQRRRERLVLFVVDALEHLQ